MKYDLEDFEKVKKGEATIQEMALKYGVSKVNFNKAMNKKGYFLKKTKIRITTPYQSKIVCSFSACADELGVSEQTIRNALNGKRVKLFEEMEIKLEVVEI